MKFMFLLRCVLSDLIVIIHSLIEPSLNFIARLAFPVGLGWLAYTSYKVQGLGDMRAIYLMGSSAGVLDSSIFFRFTWSLLKASGVKKQRIACCFSHHLGYYECSIYYAVFRHTRTYL